MGPADFEIYRKEVAARMRKTGVTIPEVRRAFRIKYSFSALPFTEQLPIWTYIWKEEKNYKVRCQAFFYCEVHALKEPHRKIAWTVLRQWQNYVDGWPFCDGLAKIYTQLLVTYPEEVFGQLAKWNISKDHWKRRQSVVSLLYYSRTKKIYLPFEQMIPLLDNLMEDEQYYVQKGVGWSLRELHNVYPEKTFSFLRSNIKRVSAIAFSPATEKFDIKKKQLILSLRRA